MHSRSATLILLVLGLACAPISANPATEPSPDTVTLYPELERYVDALSDDLPAISDERKQTLDRIAAFIAAEREAGHTAKLVFICTHNSRRSHLSQIWATTAATWYAVDRVEAYSGGTEATAFNPRAVAALERAGFAVADPLTVENPHHQVSYSPDAPAIEAFSKVYAAPTNPTANFAAVMNCSEADDACPFGPRGDAPDLAGL